MTRRGYVRTAAIIREVWPPNRPQRRSAKVKTLVNLPADMMAEDNPAFEREIFIHACGEPYTQV